MPGPRYEKSLKELVLFRLSKGQSVVELAKELHITMERVVEIYHEARLKSDVQGNLHDE